jgi:C-terminal processing protease CtpA/Prc
MPEVLHALRITPSVECVPLVLATEKGELRVDLEPFAPVEIMSGDIATLFDRREGWVDARDASGRADPVWLRHPGVPFRLEAVGKLLYVQINTIGDAPDETLAQFARRIHDAIAAKKPEKVALDLRLNRGGNGTLIAPLVRALVQSESIDCRGRVFAIVGPGTFSAAQMLANALERYTNVTFVGEPTSSKGNAYGDSRKIILPNSGITVRASVYYWQEWHPLDRRDATMPGLVAPLTFEAYRKNADPAIDAILAAPEKACP